MEQDRSSLPVKYERAMEEAKEYFLETVPRVTAIWVTGSVARGEPGSYSNVDMVIVLDRGPRSPDGRYHSRFFNGCLIRAEEMTKKGSRKIISPSRTRGSFGNSEGYENQG